MKKSGIKLWGEKRRRKCIIYLYQKGTVTKSQKQCVETIRCLLLKLPEALGDFTWFSFRFKTIKVLMISSPLSSYSVTSEDPASTVHMNYSSHQRECFSSVLGSCAVVRHTFLISSTEGATTQCVDPECLKQEGKFLREINI